MQECDKCGQTSDDLTAVETARQTHLSPAEGEWWCDACVEAGHEAAEYAEEQRSLRGYTDEERERI